jgi:ribosome-associated protein
MARIAITPGLSIDEDEIDESFILASGPGGQNVNKVASAVRLRFDVAHSPSLPETVRQKLIRIAGKKLAGTGEIVILSRRTRSQERNRADARERLAALLREAAAPDIPRKRTNPPSSGKKKQLERKRTRGAQKRLRAKPQED